ncbi:PRC-barrel domain-containing protein [Oleisolibacter albus]|uniref:PRC-barrel domain-containing protein n=1 Tax=Oleisolibacter albus TaxID=2171757 RepID=UPI000DF42299|nr:PRC-barrel domain-containing protein [Oleisolibacter albus]
MPPASIEAARQALARAAASFAGLADRTAQPADAARADAARTEATTALDRAAAALHASSAQSPAQSEALSALEQARMALSQAGADRDRRLAVVSALGQADHQLATLLGNPAAAGPAAAAEEGAEAVAPVMGDVGVRPQEADEAAMANERANAGSEAPTAPPPDQEPVAETAATGEQQQAPSETGIGGILGRPIQDAAGTAIGSVEDLLLNPASGDITHAVVTLSQDGRQILLPWSEIQSAGGGLTSRQSADALRAAAPYKPANPQDPMVGQSQPGGVPKGN